MFYNFCQTLYEKEGTKIINQVSRIRKDLGITQEDLAQNVGISRPYLSEIENCKRQLSGVVMLRIAHCLGVKAEEIFFTDEVLHEGQNSDLI